MDGDREVDLSRSPSRLTRSAYEALMNSARPFSASKGRSRSSALRSRVRSRLRMYGVVENASKPRSQSPKHSNSVFESLSRPLSSHSTRCAAASSMAAPSRYPVDLSEFRRHRSDMSSQTMERLLKARPKPPEPPPPPKPKGVPEAVLEGVVDRLYTKVKEDRKKKKELAEEAAAAATEKERSERKKAAIKSDQITGLVERLHAAVKRPPPNPEKSRRTATRQEVELQAAASTRLSIEGLKEREAARQRLIAKHVPRPTVGAQPLPDDQMAHVIARLYDAPIARKRHLAKALAAGDVSVELDGKGSHKSCVVDLLRERIEAAAAAAAAVASMQSPKRSVIERPPFCTTTKANMFDTTPRRVWQSPTGQFIELPTAAPATTPASASTRTGTTDKAGVSAGGVLNSDDIRKVASRVVELLSSGSVRPENTADPAFTHAIASSVQEALRFVAVPPSSQNPGHEGANTAPASAEVPKEDSQQPHSLEGGAPAHHDSGVPAEENASAPPPEILVSPTTTEPNEETISSVKSLPRAIHSSKLFAQTTTPAPPAAPVPLTPAVATETTAVPAPSTVATPVPVPQTVPDANLFVGGSAAQAATPAQQLSVPDPEPAAAVSQPCGKCSGTGSIVTKSLFGGAKKNLCVDCRGSGSITSQAIGSSQGSGVVPPVPSASAVVAEMIECTNCKGAGQIATKSLFGGTKMSPCTSCNGAGKIGGGPGTAAPMPVSAPAPAPAPGPAPKPANSAFDSLDDMFASVPGPAPAPAPAPAAKPVASAFDSLDDMFASAPAPAAPKRSDPFDDDDLFSGASAQPPHPDVDLFAMSAPTAAATPDVASPKQKNALSFLDDDDDDLFGDDGGADWLM